MNQHSRKIQIECIKKLHEGHLGTSSWLKRAWECMFWQDIISIIENCETCQISHPTEPMIQKLPWEILTSNVFTFDSTDYILITDSYSSYFKSLKDLTSKFIIKIIKDWLRNTKKIQRQTILKFMYFGSLRHFLNSGYFTIKHPVHFMLKEMIQLNVQSRQQRTFSKNTWSKCLYGSLELPKCIMRKSRIACPKIV